MKLRKTVQNVRGIFRVFEVGPNAFHVLDGDGRTVDEFTLVEVEGAGAKLKFERTRRCKARGPSEPGVARAFAAGLKAERKGH